MSKPTTPTQPTIRRFAIAISAAAASTTIAIGVTAASLLGWFSPAAPAPATPASATAPAATDSPTPVLLVPIVPATPPVAEPPPIAEPSPRSGARLALWQEDEDDRDDDDDDDDEREDDHDD